MNNRTAQLLNVLQTVAIVGGLVYGGIQLAQVRDEQHRQADAQMAQSFLTAEFIKGYTFVLTMPDSLDFQTLQTEYPQEVTGMMLVTQTFETIGIMVYRGDIELATVDDFLGTGVMDCWRKLQPMTVQYRLDSHAPSIAEWFQWLAERLQEYRTGDTPAPAYEAYRYWKP
ncbi:MAG: DUF4760 domain-containing protein [Longimicrobiales bacterium]